MKLTVDRVCRILLWIGCVWFAFTAFWGVGDMPTAGHLGAGSAVSTMIAEASLQWHTVYPLWDWYRTVNPYPAAVYTHHPFGVYWMSAVFVKLLGHRDLVCNLPAAMMSTAIPPLLFRIGKRAWGTVAGTATALGFVVLPITIGFSIFHNVEVITIFGTVLFFFGHLEYQATGRKRYLVTSIVGATIGTSGDWPGYLLIAPLLAWAFVRAFTLPQWMTPHVNARRYTLWWAWCVAATLMTCALWLGLFQHVDRIGEWLAQGKSRGGGSDMPLALVLEARKNWIDFSFTPLAIAVGKLAVPVILVRVIWRRRDEEVLSLAALFGAVAQYVIFKRGADVHVFWPHYFGLYYALAVGQLVATAESMGTFVGRFAIPTRARAFGLLWVGVVSVVSIFMIFPDGARSLGIWRRSGGKYDDRGALWESDADFLFVVAKLARPTLRRAEILAHQGPWGWEHDWALAGLSEESQDPTNRNPFWFARARELGAEHLKRVASKNHLRIFGDGVVVVTRGEPNAPLDAYSLHEREPNLLEWMFTNNTEPVRKLDMTPDPFMTWEWRVHLDQPAAPPTAAPATLNELRIAHNVALAEGHEADAESLREKLVDQLDRTRETHFEDGSELMGDLVTHGVNPTIEIYVRANGPTAGDSTFTNRSAVIKANPLSLIPIDTTECDHAYPPALSTKLWKANFIYVFHAALNHRIGLEKYWGTWAGGPRRTQGAPNIDLVELR